MNSFYFSFNDFYNMKHALYPKIQDLFHHRVIDGLSRHAVEESILDHLRHQPVDDFYGRFARILGRLHQFVFGPFLVGIRTAYNESSTCSN